MQYKKLIIGASMILSSLLIFTAVATTKVEAYQLPLSTVKYSQLSKDTRKQVDCLAENIYHEAAYEPREGWMAVGFVTMNRVTSGDYASSVCGVVYQKTGKTYQFSWVGMKNRLSKINYTVYNDILDLATLIYMNHRSLKDNTDGATFYHAEYVNPRWKGVVKTKKIGQHIFYKETI